MIRVTVWTENYHEAVRKQENVLSVYPNGIHSCIADFLKEEFTVRTANLFNAQGERNENAGLTKELLEETDVLLWWAHCSHQEVPDEAAHMVADAVRRGMGILFLHSAHLCKPMRFLLGTSGTLHWREDGDSERLWVVNPYHPIAQGLGEYVKIPNVETYSEPFGIPEPDQLVFIGAYSGGEVFRSGCCWQRENGRIFYFQPGHETFPIYYMPEIQLIIKNAIRWAYNPCRIAELSCPHVTKPQD